MPVFLGDDLTLTCLTGSPNDPVVWFYDDTILFINGSRMLVIPAVLSHNVGVYMCRSRSDNTLSQPFTVFSRGEFR